MVGLREYRNRDLALIRKGDTLPVAITAELSARGWSGGEFARWVDGGNGIPTVDLADGRYCGFFAFGSSESADQYTALTNQNTTYDYAVLFFGGNIFYTRTYETYGYLARNGLGPLVPLVYSANQQLYVSENGKITNEDESDTALYPVHTFPNGDAMPANSLSSFGIVSVPPSSLTEDYLGVQTNNA